MTSTSTTAERLLDERLALSVRDTARLLGVSKAAVYKRIERGDLPRVGVGSSVMIPTRALRDLLGEA